MDKSNVLLISHDEKERCNITNFLNEFYNVITIGNTDIEYVNNIIVQYNHEDSVVIIDCTSDYMDAIKILTELKDNKMCAEIPVIVITGPEQIEIESKALRMGVREVIRKPFNGDLLRFRLDHAFSDNYGKVYSQLMFLEEYDSLTGLYNKTKFLEKTKEMFAQHKDESFAFINFDIDRFQLINSYFGTDEGNRLLKYLGELFKKETSRYKYYTYGHMESDIFCICVNYDKNLLLNDLKGIRKLLASYNPNYNIVPSIGIYIVNDSDIPVEKIYEGASLAAKSCKGSYMNSYAFYDENMSCSLEKEQEIISEMKTALSEKQFSVYYQPKYDIENNKLVGAEALVRWIHPKKGIVSPADFIPIFEKNGFIVRLDYYVWEEVCRSISRWIKEGKRVYPVSVNISRVNLYNPRFVERITGLVSKYQIPAELLQLELTESAYTDNPHTMSLSMSELQKQGFTILMDDFGSGYSSLSVLKDIAVDIIKIDMRFFSKTNIDGRGENIIASVIRMAKWLHIPVIAEGVEKKEQVEFLRGIGCEYVQGYYYAKPMPCNEYEKLCSDKELEFVESASKNDQIDTNFLWSASPQMQMLFNNACQAVVICEFSNNHIGLLRVNKAYYEMMGYDNNIFEQDHAYTIIESDYIEKFVMTLNGVIGNENTGTCEYMRNRQDGSKIWVSMKVKYVNKVGNTSILCLSLSDITEQKIFEKEIKKYRGILLDDEAHTDTMLIIDDVKSNRLDLKEIFKRDYEIIEAENGKHALDILEQLKELPDIILLDLLMPVMDGREFLELKIKNQRISSIPVVIITADNDPDIQRKVGSIGANDYILKPFIPEVVALRVENALKSSRSTQLVKKYTDEVQEHAHISDENN